MSGWKHATRALHALGGCATAQEVDLVAGGYGETRLSLRDAAAKGLLIPPGRGGDTSRKLWTLTDLGRDWCEGRVREIPAPRTPGIYGRRMRFVATWLASLPRGIRITQPEEAACPA